MQTKYEYLVSDYNNIFAVCTTRDESRKELKEIKALGYSEAKIIREEYLRISTKQVR